MFKFPPIYKYPITRPRTAICFDHPVEIGKETYHPLSFVKIFENEDGAMYKCVGCAEANFPWYTYLCRDEEQMHYETRKHTQSHQVMAEWGAMKWRR